MLIRISRALVVLAAVAALALGVPAAAHAAGSAAAPARSFTAAQVAKHNSAKSCWTIVSKKVYNLTGWINKHPGGPAVIKALCGRDGTAAFQAQHGGQASPASYLAAYQIGTLKGKSVAVSAPAKAPAGASGSDDDADENEHEDEHENEGDDD